MGLPIQVLEDCEGSIKTTEFITQSDAYAAYEIQLEAFNTFVFDRWVEHEGKKFLMKKIVSFIIIFLFFYKLKF